MKPFFVAANLVMSGCVLALFLALTSAAQSASQAEAISRAGVVVMSVLSVATALGFIVYSVALARTLTQVSGSNEELARRMLLVAGAVSLSFIVRCLLLCSAS